MVPMVRPIMLVALGLAIEAGPAYALSCSRWSAYVVENHKVMYRSSSRGDGGSILVLPADPASFRRLSKPGPMSSCSAGYAADANKVWYEGEEILDVHAPSIRFVGGVYAKDRSRAYGEGKPISTAVDKFRVIERTSYATDGAAGFYGSKRLPGAHFETMSVYAKSEASVFYQGEIIPGIDPASFRETERPAYGRDAQHVVYEGRMIPEAHSASFEIIAATADHARDRTHVYYRGKVIPGADPKTMLPVRGYYFRDARAVYVEGKEIPGADPSTFRLTGTGGYAADKNRVYKIGKPLPDRDATTFVELGYPYTKDRYGVYYQDKPMQAADIESFEATSLGRARDKNYDYHGATPICVRGNEGGTRLKPCGAGSR